MVVCRPIRLPYACRLRRTFLSMLKRLSAEAAGGLMLLALFRCRRPHQTVSRRVAAKRERKRAYPKSINLFYKRINGNAGDSGMARPSPSLTIRRMRGPHYGLVQHSAHYEKNVFQITDRAIVLPFTHNGKISFHRRGDVTAPGQGAERIDRAGAVSGLTLCPALS